MYISLFKEGELVKSSRIQETYIYLLELFSQKKKLSPEEISLSGS